MNILQSFLRVSVAFLLAAALVVAAAVPQPISVSHRISASAGGNSFAPTFSPDGRFLVFVSQAKNLATNGVPSEWLDVFLHDIETRRTELVSVNTNGTGGGNGDSKHPSVSSNGAHVVFESDAFNLTANDTNRYRDIFIRDMRLGITTLVSVGTNGENARFPSGSPLISADGRRVVFGSAAWNLVVNDVGIGSDIFVRDMGRAQTTAVSTNVDWPGGGPRTNDSIATSPSISLDGRYVAFFEQIFSQNTGTQEYIFVRDIESGVIHVAGSNAVVTNPFLLLNGPGSVLSPQGRHVFFQVSGQPPESVLLLRYDLQSSTTKLVGSNLLDAPNLSVSADGRIVALASSNALLLVNVEHGTNEIICGPGVATELKAWRAPAISFDGGRVTFLGAASENGPWSVYLYDRQSGMRQLVSVSTNGEAAEVVATSQPAISPDGTRVAFESRANNIVADDLNSAADIFLRDIPGGATHLVSQRASERPSLTPALRSGLGRISVSEFGRRIAFTSLDHSLAPNDDNSWQTAFVRDLVSRTNRALRTAASSALGPNRLAFNPTLSANGRYVAWLEHPVPLPAETAAATNIFWLDLESGAEHSVNIAGLSVGGPAPALSVDGRWLAFAARVPGNNYLQIFRRDMSLSAATNELITLRYDRSGPSTGNSYAPLFTPDGRWIVFASQSTDVATNVSMIIQPKILARRLPTGPTHWVSTDNFGRMLATFEFPPNVTISGNSRYVFVQDLGGPAYRHDLQTANPTNLLVCSPCRNLAVSEDGNVIAFQRVTAKLDIAALDLRTGLVELISTNVVGSAGTGGNGDSLSPQITGDGRYVVFASQASNLVSDDTNNVTDIFVHDRSTRTTLLVSRNQAGAPSGGPSSNPVLSPDGRTIVFTSTAADLSSHDFNNTRDVFLLRLGGSDSDADGMEDDWEVANFGTLARDGTGDWDGDGSSDLHEFRAGTNPANGSSVLRVLTLGSSGQSARTLIWVSQPGRSYRVQFKPDLNVPYWTDFPALVCATGTSAFLSDTNADSQRFYRVLLEP